MSQANVTSICFTLYMVVCWLTHRHGLFLLTWVDALQLFSSNINQTIWLTSKDRCFSTESNSEHIACQRWAAMIDIVLLESIVRDKLWIVVFDLIIDGTMDSATAFTSIWDVSEIYRAYDWQRAHWHVNKIHTIMSIETRNKWTNSSLYSNCRFVRMKSFQRQVNQCAHSSSYCLIRSISRPIE
jgi:hypothetical protein